MAKAIIKPENARQLSERDWVDAGLELMIQSSVETVRVEPLAKLLGVTKGSFYWHFKDRDALLQAMLRTWRRRSTAVLIEVIERDEGSHAARLRTLLSNTNPGGRNAMKLELSIRLWASRDPVAAEAVRDVDFLRLRSIGTLYSRMGMKPADARAAAFLVYCFMLGETAIWDETHDWGAARNARCADLLVNLVKLESADGPKP